MSTLTTIWKIAKPASGLEPANGFGALTELADSVEEALTAPYISLAAAAPTAGIVTATNTKVNLATTVHNDSDFFSVASSVVTILQTRLYDVYGFEEYGGNIGTGLALAMVSKNGTANGVAGVYGPASGGYWANSAVNWHVPLSAGDTLQLVTKHNAGTTQSDLGTGRLLVRLSG